MDSISKIPVTLNLNGSSLCFLYCDYSTLQEFSLEFLKSECKFYFDKWMDLHLVNGADYNTIRLEPSYGKDGKSLTCLVPIEFVNEKTIQEYTKTLQKKEPMEDYKNIKMNNNQKYNLDHNGMPLPTKLIKLTFDPSWSISCNLKELSKKYLDGCHFEYNNHCDELRLYYNDSANSFITKLADRDDPEWMAILRGAKELEIYIPSSLLLLENGHRVLLTAKFEIKEFAEAVNKFIVETFSNDKDLLEQYVHKGLFRDLPSHIHDESKEFCRYFKNNPEFVERFKKHYSVQMLVVKLKNDEFEVFE